MNLREDHPPRELTEDLVTPDDLQEPYSVEASETKLSVAEKLREVLLAEARGELDDFDLDEVFDALEGLDDGFDTPLGVVARELAEALEDDPPSDVDDLPQRLDALVELSKE